MDRYLIHIRLNVDLIELTDIDRHQHNTGLCSLSYDMPPVHDAVFHIHRQLVGSVFALEIGRSHNRRFPSQLHTILHILVGSCVQHSVGEILFRQLDGFFLAPHLAAVGENMIDCQYIGAFLCRSLKTQRVQGSHPRLGGSVPVQGHQIFVSCLWSFRDLLVDVLCDLLFLCGLFSLRVLRNLCLIVIGFRRIRVCGRLHRSLRHKRDIVHA